MPVQKVTAKQLLGSKWIIMVAAPFHRGLKMSSTPEASLGPKPSDSNPRDDYP
jgi:hypothetical protein